MMRFGKSIPPIGEVDHINTMGTSGEITQTEFSILVNAARNPSTMNVNEILTIIKKV